MLTTNFSYLFSVFGADIFLGYFKFITFYGFRSLFKASSFILGIGIGFNFLLIPCFISSANSKDFYLS